MLFRLETRCLPQQGLTGSGLLVHPAHVSRDNLPAEQQQTGSNSRPEMFELQEFHDSQQKFSLPIDTDNLLKNAISMPVMT